MSKIINKINCILGENLPNKNDPNNVEEIPPIFKPKSNVKRSGFKHMSKKKGNRIIVDLSVNAKKTPPSPEFMGAMRRDG